MTNYKAFIGLMWFFILTQIVCNIWGGREMYDNANDYPISVNNTSGETFFQTDQSVNILGTVTQVPKLLLNIWEFFTKLFTFDYPIFQNADGSPNEFVLLRWLLSCVGLVMWIELFLTLRRMIAGGG